jgi:hypothetical protein
MSIKIDEEEYKQAHKGNLSTLLRIYWENKPIWKSYFFWTAFISSLIIQVYLTLSSTSFLSSIEFVSTQMLSIMPNILGFNLGGYVLLIGLNSQNILDELTEPEPPAKYSLFQKQSSVFGYSILLQASTILIGYIFKETIHLSAFHPISTHLAYAINFTGFWIINFISIYAILLIAQIVLTKYYIFLFDWND